MHQCTSPNFSALRFILKQGLEYTGTNPISGIPVSILLGLALNNAVTLPASLKPGLKFCTTQALRTGIILVGLKLSMYDIASLGVAGIPCVVASIGTGLAFVTWASKKMGLPPRLGALTAAGTSICGVTAIVSLAPAIKATEKEVSLAVANVVAFGLLGMLSYPYLAHATLDTSEQIGLFLGTAVHDTSQVIGSALTYSEMYKDEVVLKAAAVTKLTRNLFLAGVIPLLAFQTSKAVHAAEVAAAAGAAGTGAGTGSSSGSSGSSSSGKGSKGGPKVSFKTLFPTFILGFLAMALLRTLGDAGLAEGKKKKEEGQLQADEKPVALGCIEEDQWKSGIKFLSGQVGSNVCLGTAMAAVGLSTSFSVFKGVGFKPFALGMAGAAVVGGMGFTMAKVLGPYVHLSSESGSVSKTPNTQAA